MEMIYLGTAGWSYAHWRGSFYPRHVGNELEFYSQYSLLNEINTTFYHIPSESMVRRWYHVTPDDFIFSAKLTREVTHVSRPTFKPHKITRFFSRMQRLGEKLRLVLIQFPPRFHKTTETVSFLSQVLDKCASHFSGNIVLEVRDNSWFSDDFKDILVEKAVTLADTTTLGIPREFQNQDGPLYYIRLLGDRMIIPDEKLGKFFLDKKKERINWVHRLAELSNIYDDVYVLINNRFSGYAINDAIAIRRILATESIKAKGFEDADKYVKRQMSLKEFF